MHVSIWKTEQSKNRAEQRQQFSVPSNPSQVHDTSSSYKHISIRTLTTSKILLSQISDSTRLDDRSLGVAACVCRLWCSVMLNEAFWEMLCFREATSPAMPRVRQVVVALGGYKKMYMVCVRRRRFVSGLEKGWTREEVQLWLSLFCVDCYERLGQIRGGGGDGLMSEAPSLMFLCEPVHV